MLFLQLFLDWCNWRKRQARWSQVLMSKKAPGHRQILPCSRELFYLIFSFAALSADCTY